MVHYAKSYISERGNGDSYLGTLALKGTNTLAVRSLKLDGNGIDMLVENGIVTYHHGEQFPMTARKRAGTASTTP